MFKIVKNLIGAVHGYGSCPNCGDNWEWKTHDTVFFDGGRGVTICCECLKNPKSLDADRVAAKLVNHDWKDGAVQKVRDAVANLKTARGTLQQ